MKPSLLDTDILSEVLKKKNPHVLQSAANYLAQHQRFAISAITRYEVLRGLKDKKATRRVQNFENFCLNSLVLPITDEILQRSAELWVEARRGGHPRYDADLIIAATALEHGRCLVTGNTAHFSWIYGLDIEDWRQATP
jgi:tRNA(fMet)-specific endonuclease VapC